MVRLWSGYKKLPNEGANDRNNMDCDRKAKLFGRKKVSRGMDFVNLENIVT